MQNGGSSNTKLPRSAKRKKKKDLGVNDDAQIADTRSEFSFSIARIAVAQICHSVGFKTSKDNALETLTNVSTRYLEAIVRSAIAFANASGRTNSNLFDLINGIHDLCSVQGFLGGSEMHKSDLLRSAALKEIVNFVDLSKEVPFAKPIPPRNVSESRTIDSDKSMCCCKQAKRQGLHIPRWLPDFPTERFYKNYDKVLVKDRKCGEKLWEHSFAVEDCGGISQNNEEEERDARMELAKGRERVKFKIGGEEEKQIGLGVNMMNGVCKGRKRVSWNFDKIKDCMVEQNENEKQ